MHDKHADILHPLPALREKPTKYCSPPADHRQLIWRPSCLSFASRDESDSHFLSCSYLNYSICKLAFLTFYPAPAFSLSVVNCSSFSACSDFGARKILIRPDLSFVKSGTRFLWRLSARRSYLIILILPCIYMDILFISHNRSVCYEVFWLSSELLSSLPRKNVNIRRPSVHRHKLPRDVEAPVRLRQRILIFSCSIS